jgi:AraC-like DNA-binding protein
MDSPKINCLIINQNQQIESFLWSNFKEAFNIFNCTSLDEVKNKLRTVLIDIQIIMVDEDIKIALLAVPYIKKNFPLIPVIGILNGNNVELAHRCGCVGFDSVLSLNNKELLRNAFKMIKSLEANLVNLSDINVQVEKYPLLIQNALLYIQERYVCILGVKEIADYLDISESYLSQLFNKENLLSPKQMLLSLKIGHAVKLMYNEGLKLNEISNLSGFSNVHRFIDCFKRVYQKNPTEFREELFVKF